MARRKTAKRSAKRTTTQGSSAALRMEKDFLGTPAKLSAHLQKEIKTLKQKESKLKAQVAKSKTKVKQMQTKLKQASKQKTATGKKQLASVKKTHGKTLQMHTLLEKLLKEATQALTDATTRQAKYAALRKKLSQFEKEWNTKARKLKAKAKSKPKTKRYTQPKTKLDNQPQPQQDSYETVNDLFRIDESETTL